MKESIGNAVREYRQSKNVTTYQLQKAGVNPNTISTIELGKRNYTIDTLVRYIEAIKEFERKNTLKNE